MVLAWRGGVGCLLLIALLPVLFSTEAHAGEVQELDAHADGLVMSSKDFMRKLHIPAPGAAKKEKKGGAAVAQGRYSSKSLKKNENYAGIHDWAMARRKAIADKARKKADKTEDRARRKLRKDARSLRRTKRKTIRKTRRDARKVEDSTRKMRQETRKAQRTAARKLERKTRKAERKQDRKLEKKDKAAVKKQDRKQDLARKKQKSVKKAAQKLKLTKEAQKLKKAEQKAKKPSVQLGESLDTAVHKMSDADRAALNLEAAQAFPGPASRIVKLRKRLTPAQRRVALLRQRTVQVHESVARREKLLDRIAEKHEFDLMTNPVAENAQLSAENKLKSLTDQEDTLSRQTSQATQSSASLARELAQQENLQEMNRKAVMLFRRYKTHYKKKMALEKATFKAQSLHAAESAAKVRYHTLASKMREGFTGDKNHLKVKLLHMQEARETRKKARIAARAVRSKKRAVRRAARLAEEEVRMHHEAKTQALRMFKQYMSRYHEMQQKEETEEESQQDLGESSAIETKPAQATQSDDQTDLLNNILLRVSKPVKKLPKRHAPKPHKVAPKPKPFGLD